MRVEDYGSFVSSGKLNAVKNPESQLPDKKEAEIPPDGSKAELTARPELSKEDKSDIILYGCFEEIDEKSRAKAQKKRAKIRKTKEKQSKKEYKKSLRLAVKNARKIEKERKKSEKAESKRLLAQEKSARLGDSVGAFHSISTKLISMISVIVVVSMGLITVLVSYFISSDTRINAEENNLTINSRTASDCETQISSVLNSAGLFYELFESSGDDEIQRGQNAAMFFDRHREIGAVRFCDSGASFVNSAFFISNEIEPSLFDSYVAQEDFSIKNIDSGTTHLENASPFFACPLIAVFAPVSADGKTEKAVILFSSQSLGDTFAVGSTNLSTLVNYDGQVLVSPDNEEMLLGAEMSTNKLVNEMVSSGQSNKQFYYTDDDGAEYVGAYRKLNGVDAGVITEVRTDIIFEAVNATTRRNVYLTAAVLALVILIIRFYAKSISNPLELLTDISDSISQGNFNTPLFNQLKLTRKDEIGVLNRSTKDEQEMLNTVTSLTNKGVTQAIIKKNIDFKPHLKDITIFFSDIRGFTAISDGFNKRFNEKSAAEIISFLNDYMSRMVSCISATDGIVDKFEGDAIMACWGVLRDDELSFEQLDKNDEGRKWLEKTHHDHVLQDAVSAVKAAVGMRYALMKYNKDALKFTEEHKDDKNAEYKPHIRIGCGLNCGRATVGFMGSNEKMEFTSIGDAVNLASRTESSNKPCGTDILMTENMYSLLKKDYIRCPENNWTIADDKKEDEISVEQIPVTFEVKGKGRQHFYGVVNMPRFDIQKFFSKIDPDFVLDEECSKACGKNGPQDLRQVRALLGIPEPDFGKVNLDEEENKVKVS